MIRKNKLSHAVVVAIATLSGALATAQENQTDQIEEITVSGFRASLAKATELKRSATSIQDNIVAEDIGKFPDQNVAESLQRITGVSISRTNGEGSKITVRGFGPAFNTVRVNNRTLATSEGGREFDFQVLPSELISGASVVKAPTANIDAGSIGAYVNISTARPLDHQGFNASGSINMAYSDLSGELDPEYSGVISNTFADDTIGVLVGVSHKTANNRIDNYRTNRWSETYSIPPNLIGSVRDEGGNVVNNLDGFRRPGRAVFEVQEEERKRTGVNAVFQWAPNENWLTTIDAFHSDLNRQANTFGFQVPMQSTEYSNVVIDADKTLVSATINNYNIDMIDREVGQDSTTDAYGFNSTFTRDALTLKFDASYSKAKSTPVVNEFVPHFTLPNNLNGRAIDVDFAAGDVLNLTSTIDIADIDSIRSHWNGPSHNEIEDEVSEYRLDGIYEVESGFIKSAEVGLGYSERTKSNDAYNAWSGPLPANCACGGPLDGTFNNPEEIFGLLNVKDFLGDESGNFPRDWVVIKNKQAYIDAQQEILERNWYVDADGVLKTDDGTLGKSLLQPGQKWNVDYLDKAASYVNDESTVTAYTQFNFEGGLSEYSWSGNAGLRYIKTENVSKGFGQKILSIALNPSSTGNVLVLDPIRSVPQELEASSEDSYLLPSGNFSLDFGNGLYLKTALAKTITRPAISDTGVNQSFSVSNTGSILVTGSNPALKPYEVNQFDLSVEYYADDGDAYSAAFFKKDISSFISFISSVENYTGTVEPEVIAAPAYPVGGLVQTSVIKENRSGGSVSGIELSALHHMDYLPGIFSGLGVQANYTYATSKDGGADPVDQPAITSPGSALEGFAKNSYNITTFYEMEGFQARIAYNWRGEFMHARDGAADTVAPGLPVHTDAFGQVDASVSYDINENLTVSGEAINLTNERRLEYVDIRSRVSLVQYTGARYQLGIRAKF